MQLQTISGANIFPIAESIFNASIGISSDLLFPISSSFPPVEFTPLSSSIISPDPNEFNITWVSSNLFDPLVTGGIVGADYWDRADKQLNAEAQPPSSVDSSGFEKAYSRTKTPNAISTHTTRQLSIWDLIYPTLLPPLPIEFEFDTDVHRRLYDYQKYGVKFLVEHESALLADEMGTGKTVMTVVALRVLFQRGGVAKALIVCPVALLRVWQDHLRSWAPELSVTVVRGTPEERRLDWKYPAHVYLAAYDTVATDFPADGPDAEESRDQEKMSRAFNAVVLDEAQYIKNPKTQRSRAVKRFAPKYRWALTGTPIETKIDDLAGIFGFVKPKYMHRNVTSAEVKRLMQPYFLRRMKKDVLRDLPAKLQQEQWLELSPDQRREYDRVLRGEIEKLTDLGQKVTKPHIFAVITALKRICNFASGKKSSGKAELLVEFISGIKENGNKALVFTQWTDHYGVATLRSILSPYGVSVLQGTMSVGQRESAIHRFRTNSSISVLLATLKTGGVGLTLTEANYVFHFDHWWNPATMWQAEDRVHRQGQQKGVNVYSFWAKDSIEERIHQKLAERGVLFEGIVNALSEDDIDRKLSTDDWLDMLGVPRSRRAKVN